MRRSEPFVCDVCGADVSGGRPMFTAEFAEFGLAGVRGKFCSMEHATQWASEPPALVALKRPYDPRLPGAVRKGIFVMMALLFVVLCLVAGLVTIVRTVVGWT